MLGRSHHNCFIVTLKCYVALRVMIVDTYLGQTITSTNMKKGIQIDGLVFVAIFRTFPRIFFWSNISAYYKNCLRSWKPATIQYVPAWLLVVGPLVGPRAGTWNSSVIHLSLSLLLLLIAIALLTGPTPRRQ